MAKQISVLRSTSVILIRCLFTHFLPVNAMLSTVPLSMLKT